MQREIFQQPCLTLKIITTRLKITSVLTRVHVSICTQGSKSHCICLDNCGESLNEAAGLRPVKVCNAVCRPTAVKKLAILPDYGRYYFCKAAGQGCWARLLGKAAGQGCWARLLGKAAGQSCRAKLPGKAAGQGCRAMLHAILQYAKQLKAWRNSMKYAVF
jgi:hypothetical protein